MQSISDAFEARGYPTNPALLLAADPVMRFLFSLRTRLGRHVGMPGSRGVCQAENVEALTLEGLPFQRIDSARISPGRAVNEEVLRDFPRLYDRSFVS